jgi:Flp pilus assembly protein TadG
MGEDMSADNGSAMMLEAKLPKRVRERGTALIEFTLILPILLVLTVAVVDFGRAFFIKNVLEQAAREGVRLRAVTTSADSGLVRARVMQVVAPANVTISQLLVDDPVNYMVRVKVTGQFNWIFPGVFNLLGAKFTNPTSLTGEAWMRSET